jgi:lipoprotein-anchoring transpeptidase ErfK/SrfK
VKGGDSLNKIAKLKVTTEEAIVRLNGLKSPVIQPGQRLRLLAGKPKVHVRKGEFRLSLTIGDRLLLEFPVGLGREGSTPVSTFVIAVRQKEPVWYRRGEPPIPYGDPKNILGSRWLGFKDTEDLIGFGIHGTSDPSSIGKEASSGCIRLRNEELEVLWDFIPIGTEVEILE